VYVCVCVCMYVCVSIVTFEQTKVGVDELLSATDYQLQKRKQLLLCFGLAVLVLFVVGGTWYTLQDTS